MEFKIIQTHFHNNVGDNSVVAKLFVKQWGLNLLIYCMKEQGKGG